MNNDDFIIISSDEENEVNDSPQCIKYDKECKNISSGLVKEEKYEVITLSAESTDVCDKAVDHAEDSVTPKIASVGSHVQGCFRKISIESVEMEELETESFNFYVVRQKDFEKEDTSLNKCKNDIKLNSARSTCELLDDHINNHDKMQPKVILDKLLASQSGDMLSIGTNKVSSNNLQNCVNIAVEKHNVGDLSKEIVLKSPSVSDSQQSDSGDTKITNSESKDFKSIGEEKASTSDTFQKFLNIVSSMEKEEDDRAKLLKKLNKYYSLADPKYVMSSDFSKLLENSMEKLKKDSLSLYFVLKEVLDCLSSKRVIIELKKSSKSKPSSSGEGSKKAKEETNNSEEEVYFDGNEKNFRMVKKLTMLLKKLKKKISELEEAEVDLSDEEDSNYFKMHRYRERFCQVYKKLCSYTGQPSDAKRVYSRKIHFSGTNNVNINQAIETWLNKSMQFPDFVDVVKKVEELNESLSLRLSKDSARNLATDIFTQVGNSLQRRRQYDLWDSFSSFLDKEKDPATENPELKQVLDKNLEIGSKKIQELINYYAEKQAKDSLEPLEVLDDEANQSPMESGDEVEKEIEEVENELDSKISLEVDQNAEESEEENCCDEKCGTDCSCGHPTCSGNEKIPLDTENEDKHESKTTSEGNQNHHNTDNDEVIEESSSYKKIQSEEFNTDGIAVADVIIRNSHDGSEKCSYGSPIRANISGHGNVKNEISSSSYDNPSLSKRLSEMEDVKCAKKPKLIETNKVDGDSDCEVVIILSEDEENDCKLVRSEGLPTRKVHQINYAFINNNFNHNAVQFTEDIYFRKKSLFCSNFKTEKNQRKWFSPPLTDLTNVGTIHGKFSRFSETDMKRKVQIFVIKSQGNNIVKHRLFKKCRYKHKNFILPPKINVAVRHETGSEKVQSKGGSRKKGNGRKSRKSGFRRSSCNGRTNPSNGGAGHSGGNGQDNNENNGNKKPFSQEKEVEGLDDNDDDDEEDEKEDKDKEIDKLRVGEIDTEKGESPCWVPESICQKSKTPASNGGELSTNLNALGCIEPRHEVAGEIAKGGGARVSRLSETDKLKSSLEVVAQSQGMSSTGVKTKRGGAVPSGSRQFITSSDTVPNNVLPENFKTVKRRHSQPAPTKTDLERFHTPKKNTRPARRFQSDEEIVRNFLERSPKSISITTPKSSPPAYRPSSSLLEALQTLSRLKGISTTIVKGSSRSDKARVGCVPTRTGRNHTDGMKQNERSRSRDEEDSNYTIPKIVMVQGNVPGFENIPDDNVNETSGCKEETTISKGGTSKRPKAGGSSLQSAVVGGFSSTIKKPPVPCLRYARTRSNSDGGQKPKESVECVVLD